MPVEIETRIGKIGVRANPAGFLTTTFVTPCKKTGGGTKHEAFQTYREVFLISEGIVDVS